MSRLSTLSTDFSNVKDAIEKIERAATDANREVTDAEQSDLDKLFQRAAEIKPEIEKESERLDSMNAVSAILARAQTPVINRASHVASEALEMSAGEFMSNALKVQAGLMSQDEHINRAARYFPEYDRAAAQQKLADTTGIVPIPVVGALIDMFDDTRPVWNSFAHPALPGSGKTFIRPEITQHVVTGDHVEFAELPSQKMIITGSTVTKYVEAGYLDISQEDVDWTDPSAMQLVLADFAKVFTTRQEIRACAYLVTQATAGASAGYVGTNTGTIITSVMAGAKAVFTNSKGAPDTLWLSTDEFYALAGTTNANTNESAINLLEAALSRGGVAVKIVHGPRLANGTRIIGNSKMIEAYETRNGLLRVAMPDVLGQRVAYFGYGAFFSKTEALTRLV